jgi:GT2 family glycosyltransferase
VVVILTFNQRETTLACLESLYESGGPAFHTVVWDNGSSDGTAEAVRDRFPEVRVHRHPENLGVASGRNAAADRVNELFEPDFLMFLDNDMKVTEGFLAALLAPLEEDPRVGQTQAKLRFMREPDKLNDGGGCRIRFWLAETRPIGIGEVDRGQYDRTTDCVACGGAMMVRAGLFHELGGFDRRFDPFGPEDLDFSLRLQEAGYRALYVPKAMAYHEVSHSFSEGGGYTEGYARNKARNWFVFMRRHAPLYQRVAFYTVGAPFLVLRVIVREGRAGNLGAVRGLVRGMLEFVRSRGRRA